VPGPPGYAPALAPCTGSWARLASPQPWMLAAYRGRWVFLNPLPQETHSEAVVVSLPGTGSAASAADGLRGAGDPRARRPSFAQNGHSERQRARRAARSLVAAWYKAGGSSDGAAQSTSGGREGVAVASAAPAAEHDPEAGVKQEEAGGDADDECPICLDPLSLGPVVRVPQCGHCLHCACAEHLVQHGSLSCPQCRASLVPPELGHLERALRSRRSTAGEGRVDMAAAAGIIPGVVPRPGSVTTAADWEVESDDDFDGDDNGNSLDFVLGTPMPWRLSAAHRETLMAQLRADAQRATVMRGLCAKSELFSPPTTHMPVCCHLTRPHPSPRSRLWGVCHAHGGRALPARGQCREQVIRSL
jgi:hypothetical protein